MPNEASLRCVVCNETKKESNVSFFRIPDDPKRSLEWLQSVSRMDLAGKSPVQLRNCRICANHFSDQCFNSDLKHRLTRNAVPTLGRPPKLPRLDEYSLTLNNKISNAFLDERTNVTNSMKITNGWDDCHTSDAIVPFTTHNGGSASHRSLLGSSKISLPTSVSDVCNDIDSETEDSNSLTTKSHLSPEPYPASLFCEVRYDAETEVTNNSLWKHSTLSEVQLNQESENSFSVPVMCSVSNSLDSKSEVCYNIRQRNCMITGASPNEEVGKPFPVSLFSTANNVENDENSQIREQPTLIPENGTPFPISLFQTTSNNLDSETEVNDVTDERYSSIPPRNRKRKRVLANSLLTQYIKFLKERDIAKRKRHEEKMEELRKNNELLAKILMAIEKE